VTNKPAAKKADTPPDDVYETTFVHPSSLEGWDPTWGLPSIASKPDDVGAVVVSADKKES
jgi:hypothetical protein